MKLLKKDSVLIKSEVTQEVNDLGIVLPGSEAGKKREMGVVTQVGTDVTSVKEGDTVLFKLYHTDTIEVDGEDYEVVKESDLIAVV
jgi:chaperonin GroES